MREQCSHERALRASGGQGAKRRRRWVNAAYWLFENLTGRLLGLGRSVLIARFLGADAASLGFLAISVGSAARASLESGTTQILVSTQRVDSQLVSASWHLEMRKSLLLGVGLLVSAFVAFVADFQRLPWPVLALAALVPSSLAFINPSYRLWERQGEHRRVVLVASLGALGGAGTLALLLLLGASWWAVPVGVAAGHLVMTWLSHRWGERAGGHPQPGAVLGLFRQGLPFLAIGLASYLSTLGVDLFLALFGAIDWVGPYRISVALVHTILSALPAVIARASLSEDAERRRLTAKNSAVAPDLLAVLVVCASVVFAVPFLYVGLPEVAVAIYGEEWQSTTVLIPALAVFIGTRALSAPFSTAIIANQSYGLEAKIRLAEGLVCAMAIGALARFDVRLGIWVAACTSAVGLIARCLCLHWLASRGIRRTSIIAGGATFSLWFLVLLDWLVGGGAYVAILGSILGLLVIGSLAQTFRRQKGT